MRFVKKGSTDQSVVIRVVDGTDGTPETGVEHNTSGIDLAYRREGGALVSITEAALSALTDAHSDGGIEHIQAGYYRLDVPDAAFASGANGVWVGGVVTGMVVIGCYVPLVDYDPQDAAGLGLSRLDAAVGSRATQTSVDTIGGVVDAILTDTAEIGAAGGGLTAVPWNAAWDAEVQSECADALAAYDPPTNAELEARTLAAASYATAAQVNAEVDTALADAGVTGSRMAHLDADVSSRLAGGSYTAPPSVGDVADAVRTELAPELARLDADVSSRLAADDYTAPVDVSGDVGAIRAKTDNLPASPAAVGSAMTLTSGERDAVAAALLDLANGVESGKTLRQALRLMAAALAGKRSNAGTSAEQYDAIGNPGTARVVANTGTDGNGTPTLTP